MIYDPVIFMLAAVAAGAIILGIGIYIRNGSSDGRTSPAIAVIWAIIVALPVAAGTAYIIANLDRQAPEPSRYASAAAPATAAAAARP